MMERCPEIEDLVHRLFGALSVGDMVAVEELFINGDELVVVGTDPNEWWVGRGAVIAALNAQVIALGGLPIKADNPTGWRIGDVAWVSDVPVMGGFTKFRLTGTAMLEDTWRFVQMHLSIPDPRVHP